VRELPGRQLLGRGVYRDGLRPDHSVAEHEGVHTVVDLIDRRVGAPLEEQHIAVEDLGFQVPCRVRQVLQQLGENLAYAVLAARDAGRCDQHRIIGVIDDDLVEVACGQRLPVVGEYFLRRSCHRSTPLQTCGLSGKKRMSRATNSGGRRRLEQ
jgi:hypothetical protein